MQTQEISPDKHAGAPAPLVVGIGASAGGVEALNGFLSVMPEKCGIAFVVVLHRDPGRQLDLSRVLGRQTRMPVREATSTLPLEADCVYLCPADRCAAIRDGVLELHERSDPGHDIDYFFHSLAEDRGDFAVGVLLSGSGHDGSLGLREIRLVGGLAVVQDPEEALQEGMPVSAIEAGHVDLILPVLKIPRMLVNYARHSYLHGPLTAQAMQERGRDHLGPIIKLLRESTDFDFRRYRKNTLLRRIQRRMGLKQIEEVSDYIHLLRDNRGEARALARDLLIGVTAFFRDPEAWAKLEDKAIPALFEDYQGQTIRIWSAGCATGEEAYSLAMLLHEFAARQGRLCRFQIFATDIAEDALEVGRAGVYPASIARDISPERLQRFFTREKNTYRVSKALRESVVFASQNILSQPPFSRLDLVVCRNLLIYLEPDAQKRLLSIFQFALRENRFLFLGSSESVGDHSDHFDAVSKKWRLYRRNSLSTPPVVDFPGMRLQSAAGAETAGMLRRHPNLSERVYNQLLNESEAALAVINGENRLVFLKGPVDAYLQLPDGELLPQLPNLFDACREGLRAKVRSLVQQVRQQDTPLRRDGRVKRGGHYHPCRVNVRPLLGGEASDRHLLLTFAPLLEEEHAPAYPADEGAQALPADTTVRELELELSTTREQLNSTIEQLETANEELKASHEEAMATNEELQSANEELETSKEELQSLNEELNTLNNQLEGKVAQLQRTGSDLTNLFTSTPVATLFLDTHFHIRRFTPACRELFHLIDSDIGRPLPDITRRFADEALLEDAAAVLNDLQPREATLRTENGRSFTRRILPYRSEDNRIEGVVLSFVDITEMQDLAQKLRRRERQQAALAQFGQQALVDTDVDALMKKAVELARQILETEYTKVLHWLPEEECLLLRKGLGWRNGLVGKARVPDGPNSQAGYTLQAKSPVVVRDLRKETRFNGPALLLEHGVVSGMSVIIQGRRRPYGVFGVHSQRRLLFDEDDVNFLQSLANKLGYALERQEVDTALRESENRFRMLADNIAQLAWTCDELGHCNWYNRRWYDYTGSTFEEMKDEGWMKLHHPDHVERVAAKIRECARRKQPWEDTFPLRRHDGVYRWFLSRAVPIKNDNGTIVQWFGTNTDITEHMELEAALKEADRRKDDFLATLAHELRNPLAPIRSGLEILRGAGSEKREEIYEVMERQTKQLIRLVNELMDVSRISRGKVSLQKQLVPFEDVLKGALEATQELVERKRHRLVLDLPERSVLIYADPVRLTQVFLNLLSNAAHYTEPGGRIEVGVEHGPEKLDVVIRDNGIGMPSDMLERIFEAFIQIENPLTKSQSGLGIGLTLTRALVEMHGGSIRAFSAGIGRGTEFRVSLPLATPGHGQEEGEDGGESSVAGNEPYRVMVVDDNEDAARTLATLLELKGHRVQVVFSGEEGLEKGAAFQPDVVLMDLGMPGMSGIEAARRIRALPWGADITLVAVTGWGQESDRMQTREAGFDLHLVKPIDVERLEDLLTVQAGGSTLQED